MSRPITPPEERFWPKVDKRGPDECWPWLAFTAGRGYGTFRMAPDRRSEGAHRASWELANGPIPEGAFICHRCDNPPCVNPAHLFVDSPQGNMTDKTNKGRGSFGTRHGMSKLTEAQVLEILGLAGTASQRQIAAAYGVTQTAIYRIINRKTWTHLPEVTQ